MYAEHPLLIWVARNAVRSLPADGCQLQFARVSSQPVHSPGHRYQPSAPHPVYKRPVFRRVTTVSIRSVPGQHTGYKHPLVRAAPTRPGDIKLNIVDGEPVVASERIAKRLNDLSTKLFDTATLPAD